MRSLILTSALAVTILGSCSVYREGQTPDDVYFSPGRSSQEAAYVEANDGRNDGQRYEDRSYNGYDDYATADDRWLMMRVRNRSRWSYFDDYNYYTPYGFGYNGWGGYGGYGYGGMGYGGLGYGGFGWQPGWSLGLGFGGLGMGYGYYDPYYPKVFVGSPNNPAAYNTIRNFNRSGYNNRNYNNRAAVNPGLNNRGLQGYNNSNNSNNNNNRTLGNSFRRLFSNSNNSTVSPRPRETYRPSDGSSDRPVRVYSPSNNNSNNSSYTPSSSGGGGSTNSGGGGGSSSGSRPSRR